MSVSLCVHLPRFDVAARYQPLLIRHHPPHGTHLSDNHEGFATQSTVPGKAIVYKGANPVKEEPFTFDQYCSISTDTTGYWDNLPQPPTVSQLETWMKVRLCHAIR